MIDATGGPARAKIAHVRFGASLAGVLGGQRGCTLNRFPERRDAAALRK
jgi:hypothetical protein